MLKFLQTSVLAKPLLVGLLLLAPTAAVASEVQAETPVDSDPISGIDTFTEIESDALGQVTSVDQLSDVSQGHWAYTAVKNLVDIGCIEGDRNSQLFRGNDPISRYEMAALLNSCLPNIQGNSDVDITKVNALKQEFSAELATLRGRVDGLQARVATVEAQQFSTTTKLKGEAIFAAGFVADEGDPLDSVLGVDTDGGNVGEDRVFLANRVRLNFQTSFNGQDLLRTRLQASNISNLSGGGAAGVESARFGFDGDTGNSVELNELWYKFKPSDNLTLKVAVVGGDYKDDIETFNPYLKSSGGGALSRFFRVNPVVHRAPGDTTLSAVYSFGDAVDFSVAFAADDAEDATAGAFNTGGLCCGGEFGVLAQLGISPFKNKKVRFGLAYARSEYKGTTTDITRGTADSPATGGFPSGDTSEPFGNVDTTTNNFGVNVDAKITDGFHFSGWAGLTTASSRDVALLPGQSSEVQLINWAANFVFPDLFAEGNQGALSVGMPPFISDSGDLGIDDGNNPTILAEAQYQFKVSKNIKITPGVIVVIRANSTESNDPIIVPVIRTTFKF